MQHIKDINTYLRLLKYTDVLTDIDGAMKEIPHPPGESWSDVWNRAKKIVYERFEAKITDDFIKETENKFKRLSVQLHPDKSTGNEKEMQQLLEYRDKFYASVGAIRGEIETLHMVSEIHKMRDSTSDMSAGDGSTRAAKEDVYKDSGNDDMASPVAPEPSKVSNEPSFDPDVYGRVQQHEALLKHYGAEIKAQDEALRILTGKIQTHEKIIIDLALDVKAITAQGKVIESSLHKILQGVIGVSKPRPSKSKSSSEPPGIRHKFAVDVFSNLPMRMQKVLDAGNKTKPMLVCHTDDKRHIVESAKEYFDLNDEADFKSNMSQSDFAIVDGVFHKPNLPIYVFATPTFDNIITHSNKIEHTDLLFLISHNDNIYQFIENLKKASKSLRIIWFLKSQEDISALKDMHVENVEIIPLIPTQV